MTYDEAQIEIENDLKSGYLECYINPDIAMYWLSQVLEKAHLEHEEKEINAAVMRRRIRAMYEVMNKFIDEQVKNHAHHVMQWNLDCIKKERSLLNYGRNHG